MKLSALLVSLVFFVLVTGCEPAPEMESFGAEVALQEATPIGDILADPVAYVGRTVRIEGRVKDVCPMKGCWMEVETEDGAQALIVKVNDGEIVFKPESKGKAAVAEGKCMLLKWTTIRPSGIWSTWLKKKGGVRPRISRRADDRLSNQRYGCTRGRVIF